MKNEVRTKQKYKGNIFRLDGAGENCRFKTLADDESLGIEFEFTASNTPEQNAVVERNLQLFGE